MSRGRPDHGSTELSPKGGMAPKSQQDLMRQALERMNREPDAFVDEAEAQAWRELT